MLSTNQWKTVPLKDPWCINPATLYRISSNVGHVGNQTAQTVVLATTAIGDKFAHSGLNRDRELELANKRDANVFFLV